MFCTACATHVPNDALRCPACGGTVADASGERPRAPRAGRRGMAVVLLPLLPVLATAVILLATTVLRAQDRQVAWERAETAMEAGDYPEALRWLAAIPGVDAGRVSAAIGRLLPEARQQHEEGVERLADGAWSEASARLREVNRILPNYEGAWALAAEARGQALAAARSTVAALEAGKAWNQVERAALDALRLDPGDADLRTAWATAHADHAELLVSLDEALWLVDPATGERRSLLDSVPATRPVWSPDRSQVAFLSGDLASPDMPTALWVVGADGSDPRRLVGQVHPNAIAAWSPDGRQIAYTSVARWDLVSSTGTLSVHVVDVATGRDRDVTAASGRNGVTPTWSPSGRELAFVARDEFDSFSSPPGEREPDVMVVDLAAGTVRDLTGGRLNGIVRVLWSPTGETILAYARNPAYSGGESDGGAGLAIYTVDPMTGTASTLEAAVYGAGSVWSPAWSPDGKQIAYVEGASTVVVRSAVGERRLETNELLLGTVTWSPDGTRLLAPSADAVDPSVVVDVRRPVLAERRIDVEFDATWPVGTPQWSAITPSATAGDTGRFGTSLDRQAVDDARSTNAG